MDDIYNILTDLGYELKRCNDYYQGAAVYRSGDNRTALAIYPEKNLCIDFVRGEKFSIKKLLALSLSLDSEEKVDEYLQTNGIKLEFKPPPPRIKMTKIYPNELLKQLTPIHDYWLNRGIDLETMKKFRGGLAGNEGKLKNRYVFPIFNGSNQIIGFTGRDVTGKSASKWKHLSAKTEFKWPLFLNHNAIKTAQSAILVESPGDVLSLYSCGVENVICLFGTECNWPIVSFLIKYNIQKIIISTNNDENEAGQIGAEKIESRLLKYFDKKQVKISLTKLNDWNETLLSDNGRAIIKDWAAKL